MLLMQQKWDAQAGFESVVFPLAGLGFPLVSATGIRHSIGLKKHEAPRKFGMPHDKLYKI
jgi:hypothetical protein